MQSSTQYSFYPITLPEAHTFEIALPIGSSDPVVNAYAKNEQPNRYLTDWLLRFIQPGDRVVDLGCHVGTLSVPAAVLRRQVLAVDASPLHVGAVRLSAHRNALENLRVEWCVVDSAEGEAEFHENGLWGMVAQAPDTAGTLRVPRRRGDELLAAAGWSDVALVKLDIEGSELPALESLGALLTGPRAPVLIYESNGMTFEIFGYSIQDVRAWLEERGYITCRMEGERLVYCEPGALQPEAWLDVIALPPAWEEKCRAEIVSWSPEEIVARCLEWGGSEHRNVRQYLHRALASGDGFPAEDERIVALRAQLAREFEPGRSRVYPRDELRSGESQPNEDFMLKSQVCRAEQLESAEFRQWCARMKETFQYHRKLWEYCYIAQALAERGKLRPGMRGLGFAVGTEPLASLFVSHGCEVLGTDLDLSAKGAVDEGNWAGTGQYATGLEAMNKRGICTPEELAARASFRFVDMNHIPDDLTGFDFLWSSCAVEHVGSLELSKQAVMNMMRCLKPGGVAVHTTEFNVLSDIGTVETGWAVLWRRRDLEELSARARAAGHRMAELDLESGTAFPDLYVDERPYKQMPHLKLRSDGNYIATSVGIIIEAA